MKYRSVGKSGLKISEVALGSWVTDLKGTAAEDVAKETVKLAYDSGVNFFDCADAYSGGAAERFLGKTLKQYPRKELVISSKVYFPTGEGVNDRGLWFASNENGSYRPYRPKRLKTGAWTSGPFYSALAAQRKADLRRRGSRKPRRMDSDRLRAWVLDALRRGWSPELIEGRLKAQYAGDPSMRISHE